MFIDKLIKPQKTTNEHGESHKRSFAKAISWRITGTLDTILLAWLFTQELTVALSIGLTEVATKIILYYVHERAWSRSSYGRTAPISSEGS